MKVPHYLEVGAVVEWGIDHLGESQQTVVAWQPTATDAVARIRLDETVEKPSRFLL